MTYTITIRPDRISPWYDVALDGDHCGSFKSRVEAEEYGRAISGEASLSDDDDRFDHSLGPCGCNDYHYADCGVGR